MDSAISFSDLFSSLTVQTLFATLQQFMQQGGQVLWWLTAVVLLCWLLITERLIYLMMTFPQQRAEWISRWHSRKDQSSWYARSVRDGWLGEAHIALFKHIHMIKFFVAVCPMLGLLGTVTGMISVFDIMAAEGSSNPKLMASGIYLAILPTMVGMVAALTGMFAHSRLVKACNIRELKLEKALRSR